MALPLGRNVKKLISRQYKNIFHCKMSVCSWRIKLLKIPSSKWIFHTVSQLKEKKKKERRCRNLIAPLLYLDMCFLWGLSLPATQEWNYCCACWSASSCDASYHCPEVTTWMLTCWSWADLTKIPVFGSPVCLSGARVIFGTHLGSGSNISKD